MCEINSKIYTISEILKSKDTVSKYFNIENTTELSSSSLNTIKCFNALFSKYGLLKNLGNYILLLMIVSFSVLSILFYKVGYVMLGNDINEVINIKGKSEQNCNIYKQKRENKIKRKKKKRRTKKYNSAIVGNPNKKISKKSIFGIL